MASTAVAKSKAGISPKDVMNQALPMIQAAGGFILGNLLVGMGNKVLKIDPTNTTATGIKKMLPMLPPVVVAAGAAIGVIKVKQPIINNVLKGVAIAGTYKTMKAIMPNATFLNGDGLGLTPIAAAANNDRWLYHERTPISGMGFPDLGNVQPPESGSGYYLDPPAYMGEPEYAENRNNYQVAGEEQFNGNEEELSGQQEEQMLGDDFEIL